jgi:hypothetical protein
MTRGDDPSDNRRMNSVIAIPDLFSAAVSISGRAVRHRVEAPGRPRARVKERDMAYETNRFCWHGALTTDVEKTKAFYTETIGWTV